MIDLSKDYYVLITERDFKESDKVKYNLTDEPRALIFEQYIENASFEEIKKRQALFGDSYGKSYIAKLQFIKESDLAIKSKIIDRHDSTDLIKYDIFYNNELIDTIFDHSLLAATNRAHKICYKMSKGGQIDFDFDLIKVKESEDNFCTIFGSKIEFRKYCLESDLPEVAKHIWDHPSEYSDYKDGSEKAWSEFTKYLWIKFPHNIRLNNFYGNEIRFSEFIKNIT